MGVRLDGDVFPARTPEEGQVLDVGIEQEIVGDFQLLLVLAETAVFGELRRKLEALFGSIISELPTIRSESWSSGTCTVVRYVPLLKEFIL